MTFVDSNVPMYLVGTPHPLKDRSRALTARLRQGGDTLVTSVEVYQEILHRYTATRRPDLVDEAFATLNDIVGGDDGVLAYGMAEIRLARTILGQVGGLAARDALHLAVMREAGIRRILSFDAAFDRVPEIERIY